jgi:hypothetical protein
VAQAPHSTSDSDVEDGLRHAQALIDVVCRIAGADDLVDQRGTVGHLMLSKAIAAHDNAFLFEWLMRAFSFQGISDQVAESYMLKHGSVTWTELEDAVRSNPSCPRLMNYWTFDGCRYDKGSFSCSMPDHIDVCSLPRHPLRNGRLNQTAYSLYFFIRDVAGGDLVNWIDQQVEAERSTRIDVGGTAKRLIEPMSHIFGVSDKVVSMALSGLLMSASRTKPAWLLVGSALIAIDTLVHNFMHRTGILRRFDAEHPYGPRCYAKNGCADIVRLISARIDARRFNADYELDFPRFVQHAIWRFCASSGLSVCNGNVVNDKKPCENRFCRVFSICDHITLNAPKIIK